MSQKISQEAEDLVKTLKSCEAGLVRIKFTTEVKPAAAFKNHILKKIVNGVFRVGVETGEESAGAWGEWALRPWIVTHKGSEYLRLYTARAEEESLVIYIVDGNEVTREKFATYLTASDSARLTNRDRTSSFEVFTKKLKELEVIGCWRDEVHPFVFAAAVNTIAAEEMERRSIKEELNREEASQ